MFVCSILMYTCVCVRESTCFTVSVRMTHAEREGKAMLHVLRAQWVCVCYRDRGREVKGAGEGESKQTACMREREGGSVSHSTDRTARRQRERLKLLVER